MKRTCIMLSDRQHTALRTVAERLGLPLGETVRRILDDFLQHRGPAGYTAEGRQVLRNIMEQLRQEDTETLIP